MDINGIFYLVFILIIMGTFVMFYITYQQTPAGACDNVVCDEESGFTCDPRTGMCVMPSTPVQPIDKCHLVLCPTGTMCDPITGGCLPTPTPLGPPHPACYGVVCPTGMSCDQTSGKCTTPLPGPVPVVPPTPPPPPGPSGTSKCAGVVCPSGSSCDPKTGLCTPNPPPPPPPPPPSKCAGVVCPSGASCDPTTGSCTPIPPPAPKCHGVVCPTGTVCDQTSGICMASTQKYSVRFVPDGVDINDETKHVVLCSNGKNFSQQAARLLSDAGGCTPMVATLEGDGHNGVGPGYSLKDVASGLYLDVNTGVPTYSTNTSKAALFYYNNAYHLWPSGSAYNVSIAAGTDGYGNNTLSWAVWDPSKYGSASSYPRVYLKPISTLGGDTFSPSFNSSMNGFLLILAVIVICVLVYLYRQSR